MTIAMKTYIKSYFEMLSFSTYEERLKYLQLNSNVGEDTFGFDRYLNQQLYKSKEWRDFRQKIILRDNGCDLGIQGHEIPCKVLIHHINPLTKDDILKRDPSIFDPNNVISVTLETHNAIHYGMYIPRSSIVLERSPNDTCPWRK